MSTATIEQDVHVRRGAEPTYPVVLRGRLIEVRVPSGYAVLAATEAREAAARLAERIARWPTAEPTERAEHLRQALFELTTITLDDPVIGAAWLTQFARLRAIPSRQLRETVRERCDLIRHLAVLYSHDRRATEEAICSFIRS